MIHSNLSLLLFRNKLMSGLAMMALLISPVLLPAQNKSLADYVNPFIGAINSTEKAGSGHGLGKTFPGAATPFGMVQLSPNSITGGDNGSGYSFEHKYIEGFAFTQMSGVGWYGDLGNFLVTPTTGKLQLIAGRHAELGKGYRSRYSKDDEVAKAGYYAATLTDYGVRAEATVAPHSGILRFTFPANKESRIQIDLARRVGGTSTLQYIKIINDSSIEGWMKCTPDGGGWGNGAGQPNYTVYFYAQFSKPLKNFGVWNASIPEKQARKRENIESLVYDSIITKSEIIPGCKEKQGKHMGFYTEFETGEGEQVCIKSGISFSDMAGAKFNLQEIPDWNFDKVRSQTKELWNKQLAKIIVTGGTDNQKVVFYTSLYHTMIDPRNITDLNGNYPGGDFKVHHTDKFTKRSIFSGWDVFRSQFPLQTIINPTVVSDMISSLTELAEQSGKGYLERWEFLNAYSGCMLGNPAVSVLTDAYNKGIRNYDIAKAYQFARNTCEKFGNNRKSGDKRISTTLEYAYDEWCMSQLADSLGHKEDAIVYAKRALSYKDIYDPGMKWFRPRNADGSWKAWPREGRLTQNYGSVESNPYQQGWFVPHDIEGLTQLMGGLQNIQSDLLSFFQLTPENFKWNNYYNHPNEPVHLVPFMFNRLKMPWQTQYWVSVICEKAYQNSVEGLVGNEDVGQMSAWYVLAACGIHQACPGNNRYEIFSPVFTEIKIQPELSSKPFIIIAKENSLVNKYIQSARLNGKSYNRCYIYHQTILNGGKLELIMGPLPNKSWGIE